MKRKKRAVVTIETHRVTVVRPLREPINAWCEQCGAEVLMVKPESAAMFLGVTAREVYRRIEQGALHSLEKEDGSLLICGNQLNKHLSRSEHGSAQGNFSEVSEGL